MNGDGEGQNQGSEVSSNVFEEGWLAVRGETQREGTLKLAESRVLPPFSPVLAHKTVETPSHLLRSCVHPLLPRSDQLLPCHYPRVLAIILDQPPNGLELLAHRRLLRRRVEQSRLPEQHED